MRTAFILLLISASSFGQAVRDINYKYLYDGSTPFNMYIKPSIAKGTGTVLFYFQLKDSTANLDNFSIVWERRAALGDKTGIELTGDSVIYQVRGKGVLQGQVQIPAGKPFVLVAKIIQSDIKRAWLYYQIVNVNSPEYAVVESMGKPLVKRYTTVGNSLQILKDSIQTISYYSDDFPAGTPPFSEAAARVNKAIIADTVFTLPAGQPFTPDAKGLYLIQPDTTSEKGIAFRAELDYPRYAKIENLADPLIYICTRQEFDRIKKAKGDKPAFDRVILAITGDKDRAKLFMKTYFRRVEMANAFFSSYKEGWKTDRGMIYLIFGSPEEVYKFADREVWKYDTGSSKVTFEFAKSATIFDPENYVLIREAKLKDIWYEAIDMRRNAMF